MSCPMSLDVKMHVSNFTILRILLYKVFNTFPGISVRNTATSYALDGLGFESPQEKIRSFSKTFQADPVAHRASC